jgi:MerR family regulatory protein
MQIGRVAQCTWLTVDTIRFYEKQSLKRTDAGYRVYDETTVDRISGRLLENVHPSIGPDATGAGWVYEYAIVGKSGKHTIAMQRAMPIRISPRI